MEDMKRNLSVSKKKKVSRHLTVFARFLLAAAVAVLAFSCCCLAIHCLATDRIGDGFLKNKVLSSGSDPSEEAPKSHGGVENVNVSQRLYDVPVYCCKCRNFQQAARQLPQLCCCLRMDTM